MKVERFPADQWIGAVIMFLTGPVALIVGVLILVVSNIGFEAMRTGPLSPSAAAPYLIIGVLVACCFIGVASGFGVFRSRRWGFFLAALLGMLSFVGNPGGAALGVCTFFYCVLRLTGSLGPKPA